MTTINLPMQASNRAAEIEDWLNYRIYHPSARRLARILQPTGISPNAVSVCGAGAIAAAAWAYTSLTWPFSALVGALLHISWHIIDGADGDLARLTGRASANGELIDGLCDYLGHIILYGALAVSLSVPLGPVLAWALAIAAGGSHIAQNNHYESMRRTYLWWAYGLHWLKTGNKASFDARHEANWFNFVFGWVASDYLKLAAAMAPRGDAIDGILEAHADDPETLALLRQAVRNRGKQLLSYGPWLGANFRTLVCAASMVLGSPLWFFLSEIVAMNLLLVLSTHRKKMLDAKLLLELSAIVATRPIAVYSERKEAMA